MLEDHFVLLIVAATSTLAYCVGRMLFRTQPSPQAAIRRLLECVGIFVVFLAANLIVGVAVIFLIRSITPRFVSLYVLAEDVTLVILSAVQGILFRLWWPD